MHESRSNSEVASSEAGHKTTTLNLTLGLGRANAQGRAVVLDASAPVKSFVGLLEAPENNGTESWFISSRFRDNHRSNETWIAAAAAVVDLDYQGADGKKALLPMDVLRAAGKAFRTPNFAYPTPHGIRAVFLFQSEVADVELFKRATRGAMEIVAKELRAAGVKVCFDHEPPLPEALRVDPCSLNAAQFFFTPGATVNNERRKSGVKVFREGPWHLDDLTRLAPAGAPPVPPPPPPLVSAAAPAMTAPPFTDFALAVTFYVASHPRGWPASSGKCPACGHDGCFGRMPDDPARWTCFSTGHEPDSGGVGTPGNGMWHGDVLDLDARAAGLSPRELLVRDGYLTQPFDAGDVLAPPPAVPEAPPGPRLRFRTPGELVFLPTDDAIWIVRSLLAAGTVSIVAGPKAVGKSTLVAALLSDVEAGRPFAGLETTRTRTVYLSEEPASSLLEKIRIFELREAVFLAREDFDPRLSFSEFMQEATAEAIRRGARLLVIDTWTRFSRLQRDGEKDSGAVQAVVEHALAAAAKGLAVLIVTHFRKGGGEAESDGTGEAIRGSTALTAAGDIVIEIRRLKDDPRSPYRVLSVISRFRDRPEEDVVLELSGGRYVLAGTRKTVGVNAAKERVLAALGAATEALTKTDIREAAGGKSELVNKAVDELVGEGRLTRTGGGKKKDPFRFSLAGPSVPLPPPMPVPGEGEGEQSIPNPPPTPTGVGDGDARTAASASDPLPGPGEGNGNLPVAGDPPVTGPVATTHGPASQGEADHAL